jgi:hypothetical protein
MNKRFGAITSSQNPEEIANTIKGMILAFSSIIILLGTQFFHLTLTANDVSSLATEVGTAAGAIWFLYGLGLKVLAYFFKQPQPTVQASQ